MDAARTLKKTALFLSAALVFAAPSFAQLLVNGGATATVTLNGTQTATVNVTGGGGSYSIGTPTKSAGFNFSVFPDTLTTPSTLSITANQITCAGQGVATCTGSVTLTGSDTTTATITIAFTNGTGGTGTGTGNQSFAASTTAVTLSAAPNGIGQTTVSLTSNSATPISFNYGTITPSNSWLSVTQSAGSPGQVSSTSAATLTISGNALGLSNTTLSGSIQINAGNGVQVTINVTFQVGTGSVTTGTLTASPNSTFLSYPSGVLSTLVFISTASGTQFFNATPGATWLTVNGVSGTVGPLAVGQNLTIGVNQAVASALTTGTYNANVTVTNYANAGDFTTIPVSLTVNGATGTTNGIAAPTSLVFAYQSGGTAPNQAIVVNGGVTNATFTPTSGSWIASPFFTSTSNLVYVTVPSGLTAAATTVYSGNINITNGSGLTQAVPITLTVYPTGSPTLLINAGVQANYTCTFVAGQQGCGPQTFTLSASDNSNLAISYASSVTWASVSCSPSTTPTLCTVTANASTLPNGLNSGQVTITASGTTNGSVGIPIAVLVTGSTSTTGGFLSLNPGIVNATVPPNTTTQLQQQVSVTSAQGGNVGFAINPSDVTWLSATANQNTTPATVTITVNTNGLTTGFAQTGHVNLLAGNTNQQITVNLTVGTSTGGSVTVTNSAGTALTSTSGLTFTSQSGNTAPAAQAITISSASGASPVQFTYTTSASWLLVNGINNASTGTSATSTTLPVTVNPIGLTASNTPYTGTITITPTGGTAVTIPVSYTVTPGSTVSATPGTLTFSYTAGSGNVPAPQTISVTGNGTFTASAASTGGTWCAVSPTSGTAPTSLTVTLSNLDSLTVNQSYTCTISVSGTGTTVGSSTVTATLTISAPLPTIIKVTNAASFNTGSISAGEIITLFGTGLGPSTGESTSQSQIVSGQFPTTLAGVQVLVGGYAAPMIYASATQVSAVVPYEINRPVFLQNVSVQVKFLGQTSNGIALTQVAAAPGIFTANSSGSGPGAILNPNLTLNSSGNPAHANDTIVLYVTGEGQTIPGGVTGKVTSGTAPFTVPVQAPTVTINGVQAVVAFYAEVPTLVAGIMQINVVVPPGVGTGNLPVVVSFGAASSQLTPAGIGAVTVAVQ